MSSIATRLDDRDPSVVYSTAATGLGWTEQSSSTAYDQTLSVTSHEGATATLTFTGTSISVYGAISPPGSFYPSSSYAIDGGAAIVYDGDINGETQSQVQFFNSGQLSSGRHTLVVTNLVDGDLFMLDSFLITVATTAAAESGPTSTTSSSTTSSSTTSASTSSPGAGGQVSTAVQTGVITSQVVSGSSTFPTQTTSSVVSATSILSTSDTSATSGVGSSNSGSGESSGGGSGSSTVATKIPVGLIIGGVIGGIALLTIIIVLFLFLRRRGRKIQGDEVHSSTPGPFLGVTPFALPPSIPPPSMSQSKGPGSLPSHGRFDQQPLTGGNAGTGAAFLTHFPPAQVTGKRQITAPNDNDLSTSSTNLLANDTRCTKEERPRENTQSFPSSVCKCASNHRFNSDLTHQGSSNGSTDVHRVYPMKYPEESPPAYRTGTSMDAERLLVELG